MIILISDFFNAVYIFTIMKFYLIVSKNQKKSNTVKFCVRNFSFNTK